MLSIHTATSDEQLMACWPLLHLLRPHLHAATFLADIRAMQQQGYVLAYLPVDGEIVALIGFRYVHQLHAGRVFYIDDLVTLPAAQGQGYARHLLDYVRDLAKTQGLDGLVLDSGFRREAAHRLYLRYGFQVTAQHFSYPLSAD
ncbi:GNAT family N-acetyltransferase [Hymenobacter terrenus]|uniref:GNAT family N-acetyltransferase n=1 Tax=Hymenobacter terrenus TaxID=1629124 RepID=UPI00061996FD|nr:GNAT family N-acetyltransferase [Hymenobacter terrenus]